MYDRSDEWQSVTHHDEKENINEDEQGETDDIQNRDPDEDEDEEEEEDEDEDEDSVQNISIGTNSLGIVSSICRYLFHSRGVERKSVRIFSRRP